METGAFPHPIKRRLTAIFAADAVGYSRRMSEDEEATRRVLAGQRAIIDRLIVAHEGRIFGTAGDSVLAEFPSSVEAVRCAVEVQEALQTRNESVPEKERLEFRIGVNLGDVMVDGADILGDGVNVAARLESIADPGGICISSSVYDQIAGKLSLEFVDLGEKSLKNITRPIRVYRLDRSGEKLPVNRRARSFRNGGLAIGGALFIVLLAVAAWKTGLLERGPAPVAVRPPLPVSVAPSRPLESPSEEMKLKLQVAEAQRARAEAELARSRADAELAKRRDIALRTERKSDTRPSPSRATAVTPGRSTAAAPASSVVPSPAPDIPNVSKSPTAPATAPQEQKTLPPAPAEAIQAIPAPRPRSSTPIPALTDAHRGLAILSCEPFDELPAFTTAIPVRVLNDEIVVEKGKPEKPGYVLVHGRPSSEGRLVLDGMIVAAAKRFRGQQTRVRYEGAYREGTYELVGFHGLRRCTMAIRMDNQP
jgi:class 3 adenylate cyclase